MHYIRFLKPPQARPGSPPTVYTRITITTDLGESFLRADIRVVASLESGKGIIAGSTRVYEWNGKDGMRSLDMHLPVPSRGKESGRKLKMLVAPKEDIHVMDTFTAVLGGHDADASMNDSRGGIVAVRSMLLDINPSSKGQEVETPMAERVFSFGGKEIHIWEETGESIARHIWDAGLVLSAYLAILSSTSPSPDSSKIDEAPPKKRKGHPRKTPHHTTLSKFPHLPVLQQKLLRKNLNVLELGAGCGIVGIALSTYHPHPTSTSITLTDLPEASSILLQNLSLLPQRTAHSKITHRVLNWSLSIPAPISTTKHDLVLIADCTYNPDVVPDLVSTLQRIRDVNKEVLVCVAMKVRHESEMVFFDLMSKAGFVVLEKGRVALEVIGGEAEGIEVLVFGGEGVDGN